MTVSVSNGTTLIPKAKIPKAKISLKFVIVGGGLGGLTAAIGLKMAGHDVTLLEQAPELKEVGAGIQVPPPSVKILNAIGALDEVMATCMIPKSFRVIDYQEGKELSSQNLVPYTLEKYQAHYLHIHRADYHKALVNRAEEVGVKFFLNSHVNDIDFEKATVFTADGKSYAGDVVVGYDGIKSKLRSFILGYEDLPYNTGDLAFRALIKTSEIRKHPELNFIYENANITYWWGPDNHIVIYLLQQGEMCNVVVLSPDNLPKEVAIQSSSKEELIEMFKDWDPRLLKLFELVHETSKWRLQNSRELPKWTHDTGNVIILGDASHATLPYLASGASQALEDAAVLTGLFSRIEDKSQIHDLLKITESLRKWRSTQVVQGSTHCRTIFHMHRGEDQIKRDAKLALSPPELGCPNRWADPVFQEFLWGYEAFPEAERGWKEYKEGKFPKYVFENLYEESHKFPY